MDYTEYNKEINKRLGAWVKVNRTLISWTIVTAFLLHVILYLYYAFEGGWNHANQIFLELLPALLLIDVGGGIGSFIYIAYHRIPAEIFNDQKKIIDERLPNELSLDIERTPNIMARDGQDFRAMALRITNLEKKKIVEFQALLNFDHFCYLKDSGAVKVTVYEYNAPLYWIGNKPYETEIELRPDTDKVVLICELTDAKTASGEDISIALMGCNPTPTSVAFGEESIYQVRILFQGKLEGDYDFRTFHHKDIFYTKPENQRILFLDQAEKAYPDIPKRLLERSKDVIKYMEKKYD
jgi:hypothetical protein